MRLRRFNDEGIRWFREQLGLLRSRQTANIDPSLLQSTDLTAELAPPRQLAPARFKTKRDAAVYLNAALASHDPSRLWDDVGLWSWLAAAWFDDVCPSTNGQRAVRHESHYILDLDYRRRYRHLLATPLRVLREVPKFNRLFLDVPVSQHGEAIEQLFGGRLYVMRVPGGAEAVELLYFDKGTGRAKRGLFPKTEQKGDLRNRFPARMKQLSLTYDLAGMTGAQIVALLGKEFEGWAN